MKSIFRISRGHWVVAALALTGGSACSSGDSTPNPAGDQPTNPDVVTDVAPACTEQPYNPDEHGGNITRIKAYMFRGQEGEAPPSTFKMGYPIQVEMDIAPTKLSHNHIVQIGLVEKQTKLFGPDIAAVDGNKCIIGMFQASYGAESQAQIDAINAGTQPPATFVNQFMVPYNCLAKNLISSSNTFYLWVSMNPAMKVSTTPGGDILQDGKKMKLSELSNIQFFDESGSVDTGVAKGAPTRNAKCKGFLGNASETAKCGFVMKVASESKSEVEVVTAAPTSNSGSVPIATLAKPAECPVDPTQPAFEVESTIALWGPNPINAAGEAVNGIPSGKPVKVKYEVCPQDPKDATKCQTGTTLQPLMISKPNATTGVGELVAEDTITSMVGGQDLHLFHELFVGGTSDTCKHLNNSGTPSSGALQGWHTRGSAYLLKMTVTPPEPGGTRADNQIMNVVLNRSVSSETAPIFSKSWKKHYETKEYKIKVPIPKLKNMTIQQKLDIEYGTENVWSLDGASTHNTGTATMSGLINRKLIDVSADAQATVGLVGSGFQLRANILELTEVTFEKGVQPVEYVPDGLSWAKNYCFRYAPFGGVDFVALELCAGGTAGLATKITLQADAATLPSLPVGFGTVQKVGRINIAVTPSAALTASIAADMDFIVVQLKPKGTVTLVDGTVPITGTLQWGLAQVTPNKILKIQGNVTADVGLKLLGGKLDLEYSAPFFSGVWNIFSWPAPVKRTIPLLNINKEATLDSSGVKFIK